MSNNSNINDVSIGFLGLLTIVFITLKLCGIISWNWIYVLAPLWIPAALTCIIVLIALLIIIFIKIF